MSSPTQITCAYPYSKPPMNHIVCQLNTRHPGSNHHHRQQPIEERGCPVYSWQDTEDIIKQQQNQTGIHQLQSSSLSSHSFHQPQFQIRPYRPTRLSHPTSTPRICTSHDVHDNATNEKKISCKQ